MVLHQGLGLVTDAIRKLKILLAQVPSIREYVDSKADLLRCMDRLIGAMKYLGEFVGDLIEMRKLTHEALQKAEWKLWNYKRQICWLDRAVELGAQWYARRSCQMFASEIIKALPTELLDPVFDFLLDDAVRELLRSHFNHKLRLLCHRQKQEIRLMRLISGVTPKDPEPLPHFFELQFVGLVMATGLSKRAAEVISRTTVTAMGIPDILTTDFSRFRFIGLPCHAFVRKVEIMVRFPEITSAYIQMAKGVEGSRSLKCSTIAKCAQRFLVDKLKPLLTKKGLEVVLLLGEEQQYKDFDETRWIQMYRRIVDGLADELRGMEFTNFDVETVSLDGSHLTMRTRGTPRTSPVTYSDWIGVSPPV